MTIPEDIQVPTFPQYTNLALNEGLFDQLMKSVEFHLDKQYKQNRMKGADYAQVYAGSIQGVMQYTTQYLLGIMLIDEQKAKLKADISLTETQERQLELQSELIELEKLKLKYQIEQLLPLEKDKLVLEIERVRQEGLLIAAQIDKIAAEILHMIQQEELWDAQELKITAEIGFIAAQEAMMLKQAQKIDKEIEFLSAKILTELANTTTVTQGLVGAQMSLLEAQKLGFAGDLKIKAAKLHGDYDAVFQGVQEVPADDTLGPAATALASSASTIANSIVAA
jgi:hypothetical protein